MFLVSERGPVLVQQLHKRHRKRLLILVFSWKCNFSSQTTDKKRDLQTLVPLILQMHMRSSSINLTIWLFVWRFLMTKPTKLRLCPSKTQISLGICPVWSVSSLSTWINIGSSATHWAHCKTLISLGGCPGWSESLLCAHIILLVLSWGG